MAEAITDATIQKVYFHPLKSGRRQEIDKAPLTPRGILHDRELMAVNPKTGYMYTQRFDPRLALITTSIDEGEFTMEAEGVKIQAPILRDGKVIRATVHSTKDLETIDQGDDAANLVSGIIGKEARVVRLADDFVRTIKSDYISNVGDASIQVGLADGAAMLFTSNSSADKVNSWIEQDTPGYPKVSIGNYRGNGEVDSFGFPFAEDQILLAQSGNVLLYFGWLCSRCTETTNDQTTGVPFPQVNVLVDDRIQKVRQPLHSLNKHRFGEYAPGKVGPLFGVNVQPKFLDDKPILESGARVKVLQVRE